MGARGPKPGPDGPRSIRLQVLVSERDAQALEAMRGPRSISALVNALVRQSVQEWRARNERLFRALKGPRQ